jgi:iron complex transport system substrate-binding protein
MKRILSILLLAAFILVLLTSCAADKNAAEPTADPTTSAKINLAGTYNGTASGYHGDVNVTVELDESGKITSIQVKDNSETEGIGTVAVENIPGKIVESKTLEVDSTSGATVTSKAIIAAVADALTGAGLDPALYGYTAAAAGHVEETYTINPDAMPEKAETTGTIVVKDAKGRDVTLDLPISTYGVSTMDVIDYVIPLLGEDAFSKLVASGQDGGGGIQTYSKLYTPIVGNYMEHTGQISDHNAPFDLEMILAMDPDVLIVNSAMSAHKYALEIEDQLTEAGIPIVLIDVPGKSIDTSVQDTLKLLGQIFQKEERAAEAANFLDAQYELINSKNLNDRTNKPTVYYEKSGYSEVYGSTSSSKSGWGALISIAGGENIADPLLLDTASAQSGNNTLDPEYVLEADPEFVILSGSGTGWMDNYPGSTPSVPEFDIVNRTGWSELKAVKDGNVYELAHAMSRSIYGFYACLKMASLFYPEEFSDVNPDAIMEEFFDRFMLVDSDVTGWFHSIDEVN